jgi:Zn-dependent protease
MDSIDLLRTLKLLPGIILGLTVHEFSHALIALRSGDSTSRDQGRITLNPLKHIDPIGFIMLLFAGFGWAKPVEFNEKNLKNPKTDVLKIAVAGPVSNALTAMALSILYAILYKTGSINPYSIVEQIFKYAIIINWGLFVFNLIPIPPLDGSHLLLAWFKKFPVMYNTLYKYGTFALLALLIISSLTKINLLPIWPLCSFLGEGFLSLLGVSLYV